MMQVKWSCCLRSRRGTLVPHRGAFLSPNPTFCTPDSGPGRCVCGGGGYDKGDRGKKRGRESKCVCVYMCICACMLEAGAMSILSSPHIFITLYTHVLTLTHAHTCILTLTIYSMGQIIHPLPLVLELLGHGSWHLATVN